MNRKRALSPDTPEQRRNKDSHEMNETPILCSRTNTPFSSKSTRKSAGRDYFRRKSLLDGKKRSPPPGEVGDWSRCPSPHFDIISKATKLKNTPSRAEIQTFHDGSFNLNEVLQSFHNAFNFDQGAILTQFSNTSSGSKTLGIEAKYNHELKDKHEDHPCPTVHSINSKVSTPIRKSRTSKGLSTPTTTATRRVLLKANRTPDVKGWQGYRIVSEANAFLAALSDTFSEAERHPDAVPYVSQFVEKREELARVLYRIFNRHVFNNELPENVAITWNPRMTSSAGFCTLMRRNVQIDSRDSRTVSIALSPNVLNSSGRLRDTLIHEMCHAATWIISGIKDIQHGPTWEKWCVLAVETFPCIPPIQKTHTYPIKAKYVYKCTGCEARVNRQRKSIDLNRKVCGQCHAPFQLFVSNYC